MEIWKRYLNTRYSVSNLGRVSNDEKLTFIKGSEDSKGYLKMNVCGNTNQLIHKMIQIAFELGEGYIDHINGNRTDNTLINLRVVSARENSCNRQIHRAGKLQGCCYDGYKARTQGPHTKNWRSRYRGKKTQVHIGWFHTELEAHQAYLEYIKDNNL